MGIATRKVWLERQSDEVQFDVLNWESSGKYTLLAMCAQLKKDYGLRVADTTLYHSLKAFHADGGVRLVEMMHRYLKKHPDAEAHVLTKACVMAQAASEEFRKAALQPGEIVTAAQRDKRLSIQERRVVAIEERNRLKGRQLDLEKRRVDLMDQKLSKVREKAGALIDKAKADPKAVVRTLREIYGLTG